MIGTVKPHTEHWKEWKPQHTIKQHTTFWESLCCTTNTHYWNIYVQVHWICFPGEQCYNNKLWQTGIFILWCFFLQYLKFNKLPIWSIHVIFCKISLSKPHKKIRTFPYQQHFDPSLNVKKLQLNILKDILKSNSMLWLLTYHSIVKIKGNTWNDSFYISWQLG